MTIQQVLSLAVISVEHWPCSNARVRQWYVGWIYRSGYNARVFEQRKTGWSWWSTTAEAEESNQE